MAKGVNDFHRLHLKGSAAVLTEHGTHRVQHYLSLGQVSGCDLYENVLRVYVDLQPSKTYWQTMSARQSAHMA